MIKRLTSLILMITALHFAAQAQFGQIIHLDATTNGTSGQMSETDQGYYLRDDDSGDNNSYAPGIDYTYTVYGTCTSPQVLSIYVEVFDIDPSDTVFIYDGPSTIYPVIVAANNDNSILSHNYYISSRNGHNALTVRIKSNNDSQVGQGFSFLFKCTVPCEYSTPIIDNEFDRYVDGENIGVGHMQEVVQYDTSIAYVNGVPVETYHVNRFLAANLCEGECIQFRGHGEYGNSTDTYTPTDATTSFRWSFGAGEPRVGVGLTNTGTVCYPEASCYYVTLSLVDEHNCASNGTASMYVRIAPNPINTLGELETICANDSILVTVGFDETSIVSMEHISIENSRTRVNNTKTFIPDGPACNPSNPCYEAPVSFDEFPAGSTITSASDICSVCINYEHSFMGDYRLQIVCPNGQTAILKYAESSHDPLWTSSVPDGAAGGSGTYTGFPYGGSGDATYDGNGGGYCDSVFNMYGDGLEYCFSRNGNYTLADGYPADDNTTLSSHYIANTSNAYQITVSHRYETIPRPFVDAGTSCGTLSVTTKKPSNREAKSDYYMPADDFATLVGCPLNGEWKMRVCDFWQVDNGWVFSWSMDLCNAQTDNYNCSYDVKVDSFQWAADPRQSDIYRGEYRGLHIVPAEDDEFSTYVTTVDTGGVFDLYLTAIDEFGCHWDTSLVFTANPLPHTVTVVNKCPDEAYTWVDGNTYIEPPTPRPEWIFPARTGCDSVVALQIVNDRIPEAHISVVPSYVSYDHHEVTLYDASEGNTDRVWYFDNETSTDQIATFDYPIEKDSLRVMMIATSQFNCPDTAYVTIPMDKTLIWVPNAFTPDRDDNAYFYIQGNNILDDAQVYIYNRMGALVASWVGFEGSWDGHHDGKRCAGGVYSWVVKYHSSFEPSRWHYKTGTVSLLR